MNIELKGGKTRRIPKKYVPDSLSKKDKEKQIKSIAEGKPRPKVKAPSRRSTWTVKFEKKYGYNIRDPRVSKEILTKTGMDKILNKGRAAYYTGGSRPNQTPDSWAYARLASVIMGGPARKVDANEWEKYKRV